MERQFKRFGLKAEFVTAIDSRRLDKKQLDAISDTKAVKEAPHWLLPGIIACSASHRLCFQKMIEAQDSYALILEDDVILHKDIVEVLKNLEAQIKTGEVLMLYFQSKKTINFSKAGMNNVNTNHHLMYPVNFEWLGSSGAYLISLDVAKKLYDHEYPIKSCIDSWGRFIASGWIKTLRVLIPFAAHSSLEESAVDYVDPKRLKGKIKKIIATLRLFPFYQFLHWRRKQHWKKSTQYVFTDMPSPLQKE